MATSIVSPSGGSVPGMQQIDSAFSNIYNMFGGKASGPAANLFGQNISGAGTGPAGVTPMAPNNPNNVQMYANMANLMSSAAPALMQEGGNLVSTGMGVVPGGLDMAGAGFGTTQAGVGTMGAGLATLQPAIDFYAKLASGDPTAMTQALSPGATAESNIITNAQSLNAMGGAKGGLSNFEGSAFGTRLAGDVGTAALNLQPQALAALGQLGGEVAGIGEGIVGAGGTQAGIGEGIAGTGLNIAGLGAGMIGQGLDTAQNVTGDALRKVAMNYQYGAPQTFQTISSGLNQLV